MPATAGLTAQETWAWEQLRQFGRVDLSRFNGLEGDQGRVGAQNAETWPQHRVLSADFLRLILQSDDYATELKNRDIVIRRARVLTQFDASWARLRGSLRFDECRFHGRVVLNDAEFDGTLDFSGCVLDEEAHFNRLKVGAGLRLVSSAIAEKLSLGRATVDGDTLLQDLTAPEIHSFGIKIGGEFRLFDVNVERRLNLLACDVDGSVGVRNLKCGAVTMSRSRVDGDFHVNSAKASSIDATRIGVNGNVVMAGVCTSANLDLTAAQVDGEFEISDAQITGEFHGAQLAVGGLFKWSGGFCNALLLERAELGALAIRGAKIAALILRRSRVSAQLEVQQVSLREVDLEGAKVEGALALHKCDWQTDAQLILRDAEVGVFATGVDDMQTPDGKGRRSTAVVSDLRGFRFGRFGVSREGVFTSLADSNAKHLAGWARSASSGVTYSPQLYRSLANALDAMGQQSKATDIRVAMFSRERSARGTSLTQRVMLTLSDAFIGYGYKNHRALLWFLVLVATATAVGLHAERIFLPVEPAARSAVASLMDWMGFAFGNAIPVITLDPSHSTFLTDRFCGARLSDGMCSSGVPDGLKAFFYVMKVAGFVILSYLAAGLTGLAQRRD